jgi:hypothetical protein
MAVKTSSIGIRDHGLLLGLADDDHTAYQKESEKGAANGYAGLDASAIIEAAADRPYSEIPAAFVASDVLRGSNDAEITPILETAYTWKKTLTLTLANGTLRIKFDIRKNTGGTYYGKIYRNGSPVGTEQSGVDTSYVTKSEDIAGWSIGDTCALWVKSSEASVGVAVRNFRIYGDKVEPTYIT